MKTVIDTLKAFGSGIGIGMRWYWWAVNDKTKPVWFRIILGLGLIVDIALIPAKLIVFGIGLLVKRQRTEEMLINIAISTLEDLGEEGS